EFQYIPHVLGHSLITFNRLIALQVAGPITENEMRFLKDYPEQARLRGSRSEKTESALLSGLSREASTKRRSGISGISKSLQLLGLFQWLPKSPCKARTSYSFVQHI
ncbi:MAG TPA: hypothetical protein K8V56_02115, partial [Sporosarcina psychrophila]|nr:hypothetical protein [Sporosarcina psychrophila]